MGKATSTSANDCTIKQTNVRLWVQCIHKLSKPVFPLPWPTRQISEDITRQMAGWCSLSPASGAGLLPGALEDQGGQGFKRTWISNCCNFGRFPRQACNFLFPGAEAGTIRVAHRSQPVPGMAGEPAADSPTGGIHACCSGHASRITPPFSGSACKQ